MTILSHSSFEAEEADRLGQLLCFSFVNFATAYSRGRGQIRFPFGWCKVEAGSGALHITAGADNPPNLERVEATVLDRLKRIAHRRRHDLTSPAGKNANSHAAADGGELTGGDSEKVRAVRRRQGT